MCDGTTVRRANVHAVRRSADSTKSPNCSHVYMRVREVFKYNWNNGYYHTDW